MSVNTSNEYDPGKAAYLRNPNFAPSPVSDFREVQPMPGTCLRCVFGQGDHAADCQARRTVGGEPEARRGYVELPPKPEVPRSAAVHVKRDPLEGLKPTPHLDGLAQQAVRMEQDIQRGRYRL